MRLKQMMRWFGPADPVGLNDIRQAGCTGVVTALHQIPVGDVWLIEDIIERKKLIENAGLSWTVVESLPVHEDIKSRTGGCDKYVDNYKESLKNLGACGLEVVTYNFMPVVDWMRTDLSYQLPSGSTALKFDWIAFIAFDVLMLKRPNAQRDYDKEDIDGAIKFHDNLSEEQRYNIFPLACWHCLALMLH